LNFFSFIFYPRGVTLFLYNQTKKAMKKTRFILLVGILISALSCNQDHKLEGDDYTNWGLDDMYIETYVLNKLNLTPV
jgi:hypothetical protein